MRRCVREALPAARGGPGEDQKQGERGAVLIAVGLFLLFLLGFAALGTEAGRFLNPVLAFTGNEDG
jgi:hypothetical protein